MKVQCTRRSAFSLVLHSNEFAALTVSLCAGNTGSPLCALSLTVQEDEFSMWLAGCRMASRGKAAGSVGFDAEKEACSVFINMLTPLKKGEEVQHSMFFIADEDLCLVLLAATSKSSSTVAVAEAATQCCSQLCELVQGLTVKRFPLL